MAALSGLGMTSIERLHRKGPSDNPYRTSARIFLTLSSGNVIRERYDYMRRDGRWKVEAYLPTIQYARLYRRLSQDPATLKWRCDRSNSTDNGFIYAIYFG